MDIRHFGIFWTAYEVFMTAINLFCDFRIIRVFTKDVVDLNFLETGEGFQCKFLDKRQVLALAHDPDNKVTESFVRTALGKGDECYGSFDGEVLAGFAWYSNKPTDDEGLTFHFRPDYMYAYAALTHPKYRGRRLSAIRATRARREYLRRGFKGTVSTIDSHNLRSLRSSYASFGIRDIGYIFVLRIGRLAWIHTSHGCREHGVFLAKPAAEEPVPRLDERSAWQCRPCDE